MSMAGTSVHEYRVERFLGQGAYAEVYLCTKEEHGAVQHYVRARARGARQLPSTLASRHLLRRPAQAAKVFNKSILRKNKNWRKVGRKMVFDTALTEVEREIALMKKIRHPRIVELYEVVDDPDQGKLYMCACAGRQARARVRPLLTVAPKVLEYMSGGELMSWDPPTGRFSARESCGKDVMDSDTARLYFRDLVEAIAFLHTHKIVHRDMSVLPVAPPHACADRGEH